MIRKSKILNVAANKEWKEIWVLKVKELRVISAEKGLTLGESILRLMEAASTLYSDGKLVLYPDKGPVSGGNPHIALVAPRAHEEEWELAKRQVKAISIKLDAPVVSILLSLIAYALSHPEVLDSQNT